MIGGLCPSYYKIYLTFLPIIILEFLLDTYIIFETQVLNRNKHLLYYVLYYCASYNVLNIIIYTEIQIILKLVLNKKIL